MASPAEAETLVALAAAAMKAAALVAEGVAEAWVAREATWVASSRRPTNWYKQSGTGWQVC